MNPTTEQSTEPLALVAAVIDALSTAEAALIGPSDEYEGCAEALAKVRAVLHGADRTAPISAALSQARAKGFADGIELAVQDVEEWREDGGMWTLDHVVASLKSLSEAPAPDCAPCQSCGAPVRHDTWLPDDLFAQISGDGGNGMFCPTCLVARCVETFGWASVRLIDAHAPIFASSEMVSALQEACDHLSIEADCLKSGITILGRANGKAAYSDAPEDANTLARIKEIEQVIARADLAIRRADPPSPAVTAAEAARNMLATYDLMLSGDPITDAQRKEAKHIATAACFAAEAFLRALPGGSDAHALCRAFLTALYDPLSPDLDYLRNDPAAGQEARDARALAEGGAGRDQ